MTKTYSNRSNVIRAARKFLGNPVAKVDVDFKINGAEGAFDFEPIPSTAAVPAGWDKVEPGPEQGVYEPTPEQVTATACAEICAAADKVDELDIPASLRRPMPTGEALVVYQSRLAQINKMAAPGRELTLRKGSIDKAAKAAAPKKESKIGAVLAQAQTETGVTYQQIHDMTGWAKIGGFFTAAKRNGLTLTKKRDNKVTTFFAVPAAQQQTAA